jgi:putative protein-disulfide isomerase
MSADSPRLYYVHDPMCSWCWAFRPVLQQLQRELPDTISIQYLLGGLARDTEEPMPETMRSRIINTWHEIQAAVPGTEFNYDFWTQCRPRRSTYPACRAIISCRLQAPEKEPDMLYAIQRAYYLDARNPSDLDVLVDIAQQLGLDAEQFSADIMSGDVQQRLLNEINQRRELGVYSFPSLVLKHGKSYTSLDIDYTSVNTTLAQIEVLVSSQGIC